MMDIKKEVTEYCESRNLVVPFFSKKVNRVFSNALTLAIKKAKKEVYDKIDFMIVGNMFEFNQDEYNDIKRNDLGDEE